LADVKEFQLEDEDYYAVDIARRTAYRILKCPNIKPEQVIGLGNALYALERLPMITEGIRCEFSITYKCKEKETKSIAFRISEEVFEIVDSCSIGSEEKYSYSNNLWSFNAFGFKDKGCLHLDDIELMIDEFMNNDIPSKIKGIFTVAEITFGDKSRYMRIDKSERGVINIPHMQVVNSDAL